MSATASFMQPQEVTSSMFLSLRRKKGASCRLTLPKTSRGNPKYRIKLYLSLVFKLEGFFRRCDRSSSAGEAESSRFVRSAVRTREAQRGQSPTGERQTSRPGASRQ